MRKVKKRLLTAVLLLSLVTALFSVSASAIEILPILPPITITLPEAVWDGTSDTSWSGSGTAENPYLITTAQELAGLAVKVNAGNNYQGKYFSMTADLRLVKEKLRLWTPIGNQNNMFRGSFEGNGHAVFGLYFSDSSADYVGLFGALGTGGKISGLGVVEGIIYADEKVGGIAGYSLGLIENCHNSCSIPSYGDYVGGIVGYSGGSVIDCYNTGEIYTKGSSPDFVGGIAGYAENGVVIGCYNTAEVSAKHKAGGVAGAIGGSTLVLNCWNTGDIYTSSTRTGGIAGHSGPGCVVANCYNTGDISADGKVGGIAGYTHGAVTINCYNTGYINSHGEDPARAIVGYADDVAGGFEILGRGDTIKASYLINCYFLIGSASYAASIDPNCFVSGMGRFSSPDSNITRYDPQTGGGGLLGSLVGFIDSLDEAFTDVIDAAFSAVGEQTPESVKKLVDLKYHEPFPGDSTVYSGTLLEVLNAGVSGGDDSYGKWYQYSAANGGFPVLKAAASLVLPGLFIPIEISLVPFKAAVEAESEEDVNTNSGSFVLSGTYPVDREINAGGNAGFSTSLSSANTYDGQLDREWYVSCDGNEFLLEEDMELKGCVFSLENDNLLRATAGTEAISEIYEVYCVVSNYDNTVTSRKASLTVHGRLPFTDVADGAWYRSDVEIAYKNGLINGKSATTYAPDSEMTVAEAIKLAACMHQLYYDGIVTLANGSPKWYDSYVTYALNNGIISGAYASYEAMITRREFVKIFFNSLPEYQYGARNSVSSGAIPDVPMSAQYAYEIYTFYRAGILTGSDTIGTFKPLSNIKRSEVAAILTRMFDETARKSITLP